MLTAPLLSVVFLLTATPAAKAPVVRLNWTVASLATATAPQDKIRWNQAGARTTSPTGWSRGRRTLIGALIGFGVGLPIGMATAGYVGDTNNPRIGMRLENGARFGGLGAGIGALIGALSGKKQ